MIKNIFIAILITLNTNIILSQCNDTLDKSIYLKSFYKQYKKSTNLQTSNKGKWSILLNKGTIYRFSIRESKRPPFFNYVKWYKKTTNAENVFLSLFRDNSKEGHINSTYENGKTKCYFDFKCEQSRIYYIKINYINNKPLKKTNAFGIISFVSSD